MKKNIILFLSVLFLAVCSSFHAFAQLSGFYQEDFEGSFPPPGWQVVNVLDQSYTWNQSPFESYSGSKSVYAGSAIGQGEDWLILPQFKVAATDSFSFWLTAESLGFTDSTEILVSTTTANLSDFTNVLAILSDGVNYPTVANVFQYHAYSLSAFAGQNVYVAFKNRNFEGDGVYIDLVSIGSLLGTGVTPDKPVSSNLTLFPNPVTANASLIISVDHASAVNISMVDVMGKQVETLCNQTLPTGAHEIRWNAAGYSAGIYFCRVMVNGTLSTYKLMKVD